MTTSTPSAEVIADSVTSAGRRLTTIEVTLHRFVLAELNTHRTFSRNSASSRAIPFTKQLARVEEAPAIPVAFPSEQRGMQGGEEVEDRRTVEAAWVVASKSAATHAQQLADLGVHKSVVNRLLEPFMWHTVIISATAWENFFRQRCSPLAQPEIRIAAEMMREVYDASEPRPLGNGQWHLPYIDAEDREAAEGIEMLKRVSTARCARVSYLTHEGKRDLQADLDLYAKLVSAEPIHASPMEHVATPDPYNEHDVPVAFYGDGDELEERKLTLSKVGNFLGWRQHRLEVEMSRDYQFYA